jgi:hypothetical protein
MTINLTQPASISAYFTDSRRYHPMIVSVYTPDSRGWQTVPISKGADPAKDSRVTAARCRALARQGVTAVQVLGAHQSNRMALADFQLTELV